MHVLIVEDDPTDLKLMCAVLRSDDHQVLGKVSAEEALAQVKAQHPEVILLDLRLPGMDGLALARRLKRDPDTQHIPIVAITAAPERFSRQEALDAGCTAFIVKPVNTRTLSEQVSSAASTHWGGLDDG